MYTKGGLQFMSAYEAINLMLEFGIFILTLLALIVTLIKHFSNKK
ncbi:putative holin-like toxin [Enterococcus cecorum]